MEYNKPKKDRSRKKQPFPKIYANRQEDYELFESEEDQLNALLVDIQSSIKLDRNY